MSASGSWVNASCTALKPCTVEDYPPPWGGSARPILWQRDNLANGFDLDHQGHEEGYTFKNLDMRGVGGAGWAFFFHNDLDNVALDNISMDGFNIGVHMSDSAPCPSGAVNCDQSYDHFSLTHLSITNGSNIGYLGTGNDLTIADSLFDNNGDAVVFDHNIYLSSTGGNGIKIRWKKTWATRSKAAGDQRRDRLSDDGGIPQRHHTRKSDSQHGQRVDTPLNHLIVRNNSIYFGTSVTQ